MNPHRAFIGLLPTIPSLVVAQSIDTQIRAEVGRAAVEDMERFFVLFRVFGDDGGRWEQF